MKPQTMDLAHLADTLAALCQEIARLTERVTALEKVAGTPGPAVAAPGPVAEGLSEELVLVVSAAVAAFLGKRVPIRQIRLLGTAAWAQQGRVTIQASHALSRS